LLALTTKRFFIFAFVPPREANKVIRSGPVTVHMSGRFVKPRRVWVELRSDSCTCKHPWLVVHCLFDMDRR
jgi:hypothetical protein